MRIGRESPPFGAASKIGRYSTHLFYAYQEAPFPGAEAGWTVDESQLALNLGDLNGNGTVGEGCHVLLRTELPTRSLPGGATQARVVTHEYNPFGQRTKTTDAGRVVTRFVYRPETDPSGTGEAIPGRNPATGGYLREIIGDAENGSIYNGGVALPISTTYTWDRKGDQTSVTNGRGVRTSVVFDEVHLLIRQTAADDTSSLPGRRNEPLVVPALSIVTEYVRDANDNVEVVRRDNRDNATSHGGAFIETRHVFDILDNAIRTEEDVTETSTIVTTRGYDANENLDTELRLAAASYREVAMLWDGRDLLFESTRGSGAESSTYRHFVDANGNATGVRDAVDNKLGPGLGTDGQLDRTTTVYDGYNRPTEQVDRLGNRSVVLYDPASNAVRTTFLGHPANQPGGTRIEMRQTRTLYDEASMATFVKRKLFVDAGQVTSRPPKLDTDDPADSDFVTVTTTFDPNGLATTSAIPNAQLGDQESTAAFDGHRRPILQTDAEGNSVALAYNNAHQVTTRTETDHQPQGLAANEVFAFRIFYDAIGRTIRDSDPLGHTRRYTWGTLFMTARTDAEGPNLIADPAGGGSINDDGNRCTYRRDGVGRMLREDCELTVTGKGGAALDTSNPENPDGKISVTRTYLDSVRKRTETDDRGNTTTTTIDTRGNVVRVDWADGTATVTTFNLDDDPTLVVDQNGNAITQQHDPLGRLFQRDIVRGPAVVGTTKQTIEFDGLSRVTRTFDDGGASARHDFGSVLTCAYDSFGNKIEETHNGRVVSRRYKSLADPVELRHPQSLKLRYETDRLDRMTAVADGGVNEATFAYHGTWRTVLRTYRNKTRTVYAWDGDRRLVGVTHTKTKKGELLLGYTAGYNRENYLLHQVHTHDGNVGEQVRLDSAYRVVDYRDGVANPAGPPAAGSAIEESWSLDGVGNWNSQTTDGSTLTAMANEMNEYTSFAGSTQTHDPNGNRTADDRFTYRWDFANRLREVSDAGSGALVAHFSYHVDARRTRKVAIGTGTGGADVETRFSWDGYRMIREENPAGGLLALTIFGRSFELLERRSMPGNKRRFYHEDCKGWIAGISRATGGSALVERYSYSAYGKPSFFDGVGTPIAEQAENSPWLYSGYYQDQEFELFSTVYRYHDPVTGRWQSRDPQGYAESHNLYQYCLSSPTAFVDPLGLVCSCNCQGGEWSLEKGSAASVGLIVGAVKIIVTAICKTPPRSKTKLAIFIFGVGKMAGLGGRFGVSGKITGAPTCESLTGRFFFRVYSIGVGPAAVSFIYAGSTRGIYYEASSYGAGVKFPRGKDPRLRPKLTAGADFLLAIGRVKCIG